MSGGALDYLSFYSVIGDLKDIVKKNRVPIPFNVLDEYQKMDWAYDHKGDNQLSFTEAEYNKAPILYHNYPDETIQNIKKGIKVFEIAQAYHKTIDYLLSGDIEDEDFQEFLDNELSNQETE